MNQLALTAAGIRAFAQGHFALRLGAGEPADVTLLFKDFDGGNVYADVISELSAALHFAKKHLGPPKYEALGKLTLNYVVAPYDKNPGFRVALTAELEK